MADCLSAAIVFAPACTCRVFPTEPFFELIRAHVDELIELPVACVRWSSSNTVEAAKFQLGS